MKLNENYIVHRSGNETVLVPLGGSGFTGIVKGNATLGDILDLLGKEIAPEQLAKALEELYEAPADVIAADVEKTLAELRAIGALDE